MHREGEEIHVDETEATGAVKNQGVRWVLIISLAAIVIAMSLAWILGGIGMQ